MTLNATAEQILHCWTSAIAERDLTAISELFAKDAVFIATAPEPLVGQKQIRAYYEAAPQGLTAKAKLVLAVPQRAGLAIVANVIFDLPNGTSLGGTLSLAYCLKDGIKLYHMAIK